MHVDELNTEQKAFFDHHTLDGSTYELIERRNQLRDSLIGGTVLGQNRKAATLAMGKLQGMIEPAETAEQKQARTESGFIQQAQKFADQGNPHQAKELLSKIGLELDVLVRTKPYAVQQREKEAAEEYLERKTEGIKKLMLTRGVTKSAANEIFTGNPELDSVPKLSRQFVKRDPHSLDAMLQVEVNKKFFFDPHRPFE